MLPASILALKLMRKADITKEERLLILTGVDFTKKDTMYEQAKTSLKKFKGGVVRESSQSGATTAIKVEPVLASEEAFFGRGYGRSRGYFRGRPVWEGGRGAGSGRAVPSGAGGRGLQSTSTSRGAQAGKTGNRPMNPIGPDGNPLTCYGCGLFVTCYVIVLTAGKKLM